MQAAARKHDSRAQDIGTPAAAKARQIGAVPAGRCDRRANVVHEMAVSAPRVDEAGRRRWKRATRAGLSRSTDDMGCQCNLGKYDDSIKPRRMTTTTYCRESISTCATMTATVSAGSLGAIDD